MIVTRVSDEVTGDCASVPVPNCGEREEIILNEFGHPVCFCNTQENFYPLHSSLRHQKDEKKLQKCFDSKDVNVCNENENLAVSEETGAMTCTKATPSIAFDFAGSLYSRRCPYGYIYRFRRCYPVWGY